MGLKGLIQKAALGASSEESDANKAKMRALFNSAVSNGDDYELVYCHSENEVNFPGVAKITSHGNYVVGYCDNGERSVAILEVDVDLENYNGPFILTIANGSSIDSTLGILSVAHPDFSASFEPVTYDPGVNRGRSLKVSIVQSSDDVKKIKKFFKEGL